MPSSELLNRKIADKVEEILPGLVRKYRSLFLEREMEGEAAKNHRLIVRLI